MKLLVKAIAHLIFVAGLFFFITLSGSRYDWLQEMDPSMSVRPEDPGNRAIFKILLLIVILATQGTIAAKTKNKIERWISIVFVVVAISMYWLAQ